MTLLVGQTMRVFQCHCETMLRIRELSLLPPLALRLQLHVNVMREFFKIRAILCWPLLSALLLIILQEHSFTISISTFYTISDMRTIIFDVLVEMIFIKCHLKQ